MKLLRRVLPLVAAALLLVGCSTAPTVLGLGYAFRQAEHTYMTSPQAQQTITNVATQTKINAFEGDFDSGWNCLFSAYASAAAKVPAGQTVTIQTADWAPCATTAWNAAFAIISTVRTFDPNFLASVISYVVPTVSGSTTKLSYDPTYFKTPLPPTNIAVGPVSGGAPVTGTKAPAPVRRNP